MEIKGKLVEVLPVQTGESKNGGQWKKQTIIIETDGQYPKKVCITIWGDKIDANSFATGSTLTAFIDIESREFNGRWYTDVKAWKIEAGSNEPASGQEAPPPPIEEPLPGGDDDLPF